MRNLNSYNNIRNKYIYFLMFVKNINFIENLLLWKKRKNLKIYFIN